MASRCALRGAGGRASLIFRIRVRPHSLYVLQGKDVQIELPLAPWEAALGAKVAVPTLGGTVELTVPAGSAIRPETALARARVSPAATKSSSSSWSRRRPSPPRRRRPTSE